MYDELVKALRGCVLSKQCDGCPYYDPQGPSKECATLNIAAADAIEELSKSRWIPVTERLPEPYTWVLVAAENHEVAFDAFYDGSHWNDILLNGLIVTHWMPLPEPPKEE